jgi:hypothetical protein
MPLNLVVGSEPIVGYTLTRWLGRGGFGEVWEAMAPGGVRVALKFVRLDTLEAGYEQRALEIIRNIRHPHLLDVQFASRVDDCLVLAMPLCDRTLMDRLRECHEHGLPGVPRDELLGYMEEVARAVDFLNQPRHETVDGGRLGVQHRDIKPQNVFLVGDSVRLADFGLAKIVDAGQATHTGAMSPNYVAPEMVDGHVSPQSDQYSLAVSYVQLRTGILPFLGDSVNQILFGHLHQPPELSGLPEEERAAVARALAKRPEERWPTCRAFVLGLEAAAVAADGRLASSSGSTPAPIAPTEIPRGPTTTLPATRIGDEKPRLLEEGATLAPRRRLRRVVFAGLAVALTGLVAVPLASRFRPARGTVQKVGPAGERPGAAAPLHRTGTPATPATPGDGPGAAMTPAPDRPGTDRVPEAHLSSNTSDAPSNREVEGSAKPLADHETPATPRRVDVPKPELAAAQDVPPRVENRDEPVPVLANRAHAILKAHCYGCHGSRFDVPGYNVLDRDILVATPPAGKKRKVAYVVPGQPDASLLWKRVGIDEDMPPEDPALSTEDKDTLRRWIEAGAPFPVLDRPREFVGDREVLAAIRDHLEQTPDADRRHQRYFTLTNLHNNRKVLDDDLRLYRAALAKLINSLSWKPKLVVPRVLPKTQDTVLNVDLRDLGWDQDDLWFALIRREELPAGTKFLGARDERRKGYPYGLSHDRLPGDESMQRLAGDVERLTGCERPDLRADWFIATASRPPLYEAILGLPKNARELEHRLDVDVRANFLRDRLARAGFATSGVSHHNRMVERHDAAHGAYWKSYDFKSDEGTGELTRFPLGPDFEANPFGRQAFEHAGGEIIFNLPNKLHAYLLVSAKDERIEAGPIEIVGDALQTAGSATIVNGLSCMGCHKEGMISGFADAIRLGHAVAGEARQKVERLYPAKEVMDRLLGEDQDVFLAAVEKATGPFLRGAGDEGKPIRDFPEPIGAIARLYVKDLGLEEVAAELGIEAKTLQDRIVADPALRRLGLGPLVQPGGRIKRAAWESLQFFNSPFQEAALHLELGTPYHKL